MTINEIISALEAGKVGREIDAATAVVIGWKPHLTVSRQTAGMYYKAQANNPATFELMLRCGMPLGKEKVIPKYSTSLDACAALQERVLPGWASSIETPFDATPVYAAVRCEGMMAPIMSKAPTAAAAWLAAILKAHMAKETT